MNAQRPEAGAFRLPLLLALLVVLAGCPQSPSDEPADEGETATPPPSSAVIATESTDLDSAELYFPGADGRLYLHRQTVPATDEVMARIEMVVKALLEGPAGATDGTLQPPLPTGTRLVGVYRYDEQTVALDLRSPEGDEPGQLPPSGSKQELLSVYSLVNTVVIGHEGVERVVLLWNGSQPETFAGHVDVSRPLAADPGLIAPTP